MFRNYEKNHCSDEPHDRRQCSVLVISLWLNWTDLHLHEGNRKCQREIPMPHWLLLVTWSFC